MTSEPTSSGGSRPRVHRLEPAALAGVMSREIALFPRYWKASAFSSIVQPLIYLLAFGLGVGKLVHRVGGLSYVQYVGTGVVAVTVLFSSAFPGMFNTFVRWQFQRTYDAILATPIDAEELITAEILWLSLRAAVYSVVPLVVALAFGLSPDPGMLLIPAIGFITAFGFAGFGVTIAAIANTIDNFNYVTSAVLTPLFLVAGTFFPLSVLPAGVRAVAEVNPLFHCVQLVRHAALGALGVADLGHTAALLAFAMLMWRLAVWQLGKRLIN